MTPLAPTLEAFFTDRLLCQQRVSPNTIASYRDTFRLLLAFVQQQTGTSPSRLQVDAVGRDHDRRDFSSTSRPTVATAPAPGTFASAPSTDSSTTARSDTPSTPT